MRRWVCPSAVERWGNQGPARRLGLKNRPALTARDVSSLRDSSSSRGNLFVPSTLVVGQTPLIPVREFSNRPSSRIMQIQPRRAHELAHRTPLLRGGNAPPREGTKGLIG